jgi:hypothetical protein
MFGIVGVPKGQSMLRHRWLVIWCVSLMCCTSLADVIPPGFRPVDHKLVFEDSPLFDEHRIFAARSVGFKGLVHRVVPGEPFNFSSKWSTRLYLVPEGVDELERFDDPRLKEYPSYQPSRKEITTTPIGSPIAKAVTTLRLVSAGPDGLVIEEVSHTEYAANGMPLGNSAIRLLIIALVGLALVAWLLHVIRTRSQHRAMSLQQAPGD